MTRPIARPGTDEPTLLWLEGSEPVYKWGTRVGDTYYAIGVMRPPGTLTWNNYAARVSLASMTDRSAWRFYAGNGSNGQPIWSRDSEAAAVVSHNSPGGSLSWVPYLRRFMTVYRPVVQGDRAVYRVAPTPWGPWSEERLYTLLRPGTNRAVYGRPEYAENGGRVQYLFYYNEVPPRDDGEPGVYDIPIVRVELNRTMAEM